MRSARMISFAMVSVVGASTLVACSERGSAETVATSARQVMGLSTTPSTGASTSTTMETVNLTEDAAWTFISTLDDHQRAQLGAGGLELGSLTDAQRTAGLAVLEKLLSPEVYQEAVTILHGSGLDGYTLGFSDDSAPDGSWRLNFTGVDLRLEAVLAPESLAFTDTYFRYTDGQVVSDILGDLEAFVDSLDSEQRSALAWGLRGSELEEEQRHLLIGIVSNRIELSDQESAYSQVEALSEMIEDTTITWSEDDDDDREEGDGDMQLSIVAPDAEIEFASAPHGIEASFRAQ